MMKLWHNFWFWYHTQIGMNIYLTADGFLHHMNQAERHELALRSE